MKAFRNTGDIKNLYDVFRDNTFMQKGLQYFFLKTWYYRIYIEVQYKYLIISDRVYFFKTKATFSQHKFSCINMWKMKLLII